MDSREELDGIESGPFCTLPFMPTYYGIWVDIDKLDLRQQLTQNAIRDILSEEDANFIRIMANSILIDKIDVQSFGEVETSTMKWTLSAKESS